MSGHRKAPRYEWTAVRDHLEGLRADRWRRQLLSIRTSKHSIAGYPRLLREWDPKKNGDLFPFEVGFSSKRYIWWKCPRGPDHEWKASAGNRARGRTLCPLCAGRKPSVTNSLASLRPDLAKEWDAANLLRPSGVTTGSARIVGWRCGLGHTWRALISKDEARERVPEVRHRASSTPEAAPGSLVGRREVAGRHGVAPHAQRGAHAERRGGGIESERLVEVHR